MHLNGAFFGLFMTVKARFLKQESVKSIKMITVKNKKQAAQNAAGWSGERDRRKDAFQDHRQGM